jgi:signal transduction histidine kinase
MQRAFAAVRGKLESGSSCPEPAFALERQMQRLTRHLQKLAAAGRIADGALPLARQAVDVGRLVQDTLAVMRPIIDERRHHLTLALPLGPERVWADEAALQQALSILIENAAAYTPSGGQIAVTAEKHAEEMWLRVKDNGRGLPAQSLSDLLSLSAGARRFWQGDSDGLGIGLALARSLAEAHGGTLSAVSAGPGFGCEFVLRWPVWQEGLRIDEGSTGLPGNRSHLWRSPALLSLTSPSSSWSAAEA